MSRKQKKTVFVAMSGGVDSSVAAFLLKKQGYDVTGVFMRCYNLDGCAERDAEDARRVAGHIGIPFYVFDFEKEYKKKVVEYMIEGYRAGITPNPDVMCNKEIKFGLFLKKAFELGADYVATGHYVRIIKTKNPDFGGVLDRFQNVPKIPGLSPILRVSYPKNKSSSVDNFIGRGIAGNRTPETQVTILVSNHPEPTTYSLYQAKDKNKDQSYFLWTLTQDQLQYCLFPIGNYLKSEVREIARKAGLPTAEKKDSQGICFLGKVSIKDFLKNYIKSKRGDILDIHGRKIGEHEGAQFYTIGQRHINIIQNSIPPKRGKNKNDPGQISAKFNGAGNSKSKSFYNPNRKPLYVVEKDVKNNTIVVSEDNKKSALYRKEILLRDVYFINNKHSNILQNVGMLKVLARVRYRQPLAPAMLAISDRQQATNNIRSMSHVSYLMSLVFKKPQKFIAPGQSAVFYTEGGEMIGGGIIV